MRPLAVFTVAMALSASAPVLAEPGVAPMPSEALYPFRVDLPEGFTIVARPQGPDFQVYDIERGEVGYVGVYEGCAASFPIKENARVVNRGRGLKVAMRGRRVVEYLWTSRCQLHVWVQETPDVDAAVADKIAASIRPK